MINPNIIHALDADLINTAYLAQVERNTLKALIVLMQTNGFNPDRIGLYYSTKTTAWMIDKFPTAAGKKVQEDMRKLVRERLQMQLV